MEKGEIKDYTQVDSIDRIRRAHAQRHHVQNSQQLKTGPKKSGAQRSMPCQFFNQNTCVHTSSHDTKGVSYKHVSSFCFSQLNKSFPHPKKECRNKNKNAKNE